MSSNNPMQNQKVDLIGEYGSLSEEQVNQITRARLIRALCWSGFCVLAVLLLALHLAFLAAFIMGR